MPPIRKGLIDHLTESTSLPASELSESTDLITSGLLDSLALFNLAVWIENQIGADLKLAELNIPAEWNTVEDIIDFIARHKV